MPFPTSPAPPFATPFPIIRSPCINPRAENADASSSSPSLSRLCPLPLPLPSSRRSSSSSSSQLASSSMLLDLRSRRGGGRRRRRRSSSSPAACRRESTRLTAGGEGGGGGDFPRDRDRDRGGDRGGDLGRDRSASSGLLDGWRRGRGTFLSPYLSSLLFKSSTKAFVLTLGGFGGVRGMRDVVQHQDGVVRRVHLDRTKRIQPHKKQRVTVESTAWYFELDNLI